MTPQRLSPEDAAILALESPAIAGHTCKVLVLGPPRSDVPTLTVATLRERIQAGLDSAPRLRQKVVPTPLGLARPVWVDDPAFDLARHVRRAPVPDGPLDDEALRDLAARAMEDRLDRAHPLWTIDVVEPVNGGPAALLWKLHHALADGMEMLRLADAVLWDRSPHSPGEVPLAASASAEGSAGIRPGDAGQARAWHPRPAPGTAGLVAAALRERVRDAAGGAVGLARGALSPSGWRAAAGEARRLPGALARDLAPERFASPLDAPAGVRREVAFAAVPVADLKRIEHAQPGKVTVNDVLLAMVAGGLRRWVVHHGGEAHELRVKVPVSLHDRHAHPDALANRDSFLCVALPLDEPDPTARLRQIAVETGQCKREHDAQTLDALFRGLRHAPRPIARLAARLAAGPRTFALEVSNVPGPVEPRWVLGHPVTALRSLAEIGERHALRVTAMSLDGTLHLGLCADAAAVEDVGVLAAGMREEAAALLHPA